MVILDKKFVENNKEQIIDGVRNGAIFIYPTDTIYGIGTNALNADSVKKIREIKQREIKPFSIIAPSKEWIENNCETNKEVKKWVEKLPGPYTLFLNIKKENCVDEGVNPAQDSLGVRIPKHWFAKIIEEFGIPFVTTSVNISGQSYMRRIEDIDEAIKNSVDYIIYEGEKANKESEKVDLREDLKK